ncbi:MAG: addiction module protein [Planctomycetes bacterium]|nr:addiction module protein [Planctomycetota bacterium]
MTKTAKQVADKALKLDEEERYELAMLLFQSTQQPYEPDAKELAFIEKCAAEYRAHPEKVVPWEQAMRELDDRAAKRSKARAKSSRRKTKVPQ